jgi:hypothetical protein
MGRDEGVTVYRQYRRLIAGLCLALGVMQAGAREAGVVFVVQPALPAEEGEPAPRTGDLAIEPLGYLRAGKLVQIPASTDTQQFARAYYAPQREYSMYSDGIRMGGLRPRGGLAAPCDNLQAAAHAVGDMHFGPSGMGLATDVQLPGTGLQRFNADAAEMAFAQTQIGRIFERHGLPAALPAVDHPDGVVVYSDARHSLMVATFSTPMRRRVDGVEVSGLHAGFFIAERTGNGPYRLARSWFHSGLEAEVIRPVLVDIADFDGDGTPEIVMQNFAYEDYAFHVWHRRGDSWVDSYSSPGASCM